MYAVSAQVEYEKDGWRGSRGVPTFYLDENVQGITSEEAAVAVARRIIDPLGERTVHITAVYLGKNFGGSAGTSTENFCAYPDDTEGAHDHVACEDAQEDEDEPVEDGEESGCLRHGAQGCSDPYCIQQRGGSVFAAELRDAENWIGTE